MDIHIHSGNPPTASALLELLGKLQWLLQTDMPWEFTFFSDKRGGGGGTLRMMNYCIHCEERHWPHQHTKEVPGFSQ